ncbi:PDR/VanB family oxidoreductase [Castellaniella hirudinis]|uniref:PDR/VanB family oxidoreductase n=1 Tax=Castellaniella hirudinis TaxID=1144617 RepID=UPI0039C2B87E
MDTTLISVLVAGKTTVARDTVCFEFTPMSGTALPAYAPGAHIDVHLPGGLIRPYSLLDAGAEAPPARYRIAVLRETASRGGSVALHDRVRVGDILQVTAPRNRFPLVPAAHSVLFAGGIGVTPLWCMGQRLLAQGASFALHYSSRTAARAAFLADIRQGFAGHAHCYFDDQPDRALDVAAILAGCPADTQAYICGPAGYIDAVQSRVRAAGLAADRIHIEQFALDAADRPAITATDVAFQVQLDSTGEIFDIPADESITSALDRQGVFIPVSCEEGICGTCLTGLKGGIPDHRDTYLTDEEHAANDQFMPCCSRAKTPLLILDL